MVLCSFIVTKGKDSSLLWLSRICKLIHSAVTFALNNSVFAYFTDNIFGMWNSKFYHDYHQDYCESKHVNRSPSSLSDWVDNTSSDKRVNINTARRYKIIVSNLKIDV